MSGLIERAAQAAEARAGVIRARVRARIAAALPGVSVREEGDALVVRGRGLVARWIASNDLRDFREGEP